MSYGDEYYCPNCGATLNDQYGFDPDKGSWTCTECGQHLMDDDIYDGDTFEGVEWRCDCCNALLNRQYGFSDSLGSWTCTECGHTNGISEDDIIDESDIVRCPNCDGVINNQFGFNEYDNDCECSFCGAKLHREYTCDDFHIVEDDESSDEDKFECPNCGDELTDQWGFDKYDDDWTCSSCGAKLHHDYSDDEYEVAKEKEEHGSESFTSSHSYSNGGYSYSGYEKSRTTHNDNKTEVQKFYCPNCGSLLNKQYEFSHKSDEYTCKVCHTALYHYYTDEPYKAKHTRERATPTSSTYTSRKEHSTSSYTRSATSYSSSHRSHSVSSKSKDWLLFFLCLFLGYFGMHKFAEGKVGMGILYILTVGLFYIGWFVDIAKYFKRAIA